MLQGSGIGSKADYGNGGCGGAVEERESLRMGAESKWNQGKGGGADCK